MARSLIVNSHTTIPASELFVSFVRSSGPGGQNVNKVNSKVILRWNVAATNAISLESRDRFIQLFSSRISQAGNFQISSDKTRDQARNLSDCYEKLRQFVQSSLVPPRKRKATHPTKGSNERRLADKRQKSLRKQHRKHGVDEE